MAGYANPRALIEIGELEQKLNDPKVRIVDVDEDVSLYGKGHIPGALSWNWKTDLHDPLRRELVDRAGLERLLTRSGIGKDTTVVLYSGNNNWFAAYAYWLLKYRGLDNVKLLNGGRKKWELDKKPTTTEVPSYPAAADPVSLPANAKEELRALRDDVLAAVKNRDKTFVDVRSPEEYRGELLAPAHLPQEVAQVPGHIPSAANIPWSRAAKEDGTFKDVSELKALYEQEGVRPDREVVAYCRIGERSSHTWVVLRELLGFEKVRNYDGSWTEYGSLIGAPVER